MSCRVYDEIKNDPKRLKEFNERVDKSRDNMPDEEGSNANKHFTNLKGFNLHKSLECQLRYQKAKIDKEVDALGQNQGLSIFELAFLNTCYYQVIESRQVTRWSFAVLQAMNRSLPEDQLKKIKLRKHSNNYNEVRENILKKHYEKIEEQDKQIRAVLDEVHELCLSLHKLLGMLIPLDYRKNEVYILKEIKEKLGADPRDLVTKEKDKEFFQKFKVEAILKTEILKKKTEAFGEMVYAYNVV